MIPARVRTLVFAALLGASTLGAQERDGPTITLARAAFFPPPSLTTQPFRSSTTPADCGSALKNAALLGLGASFAAFMLELTYMVIREPLVRNGHDWPAADPAIIAWAGAAGFALGLVSTEMCRRRRR